MLWQDKGVTAKMKVHLELLKFRSLPQNDTKQILIVTNFI